jgi:hypothetical protein
MGHGVADFENFVPPDHYVFMGGVKKKSILHRYLPARITAGQWQYDTTGIIPTC